MPHSHKKKTRAVKCCLAVGLLAIAAASVLLAALIGLLAVRACTGAGADPH